MFPLSAENSVKDNISLPTASHWSSERCNHDRQRRLIAVLHLGQLSVKAAHVARCEFADC